MTVQVWRSFTFVLVFMYKYTNIKLKHNRHVIAGVLSWPNELFNKLSNHQNNRLFLCGCRSKRSNILHKASSTPQLPKSKHLKACLGPACLTVLDQRGPPWHSVRYGFALSGGRFWIRNVDVTCLHIFVSSESSLQQTEEHTYSRVGYFGILKSLENCYHGWKLQSPIT